MRVVYAVKGKIQLRIVDKGLNRTINLNILLLSSHTLLQIVLNDCHPMHLEQNCKESSTYFFHVVVRNFFDYFSFFRKLSWVRKAVDEEPWTVL